MFHYGVVFASLFAPGGLLLLVFCVNLVVSVEMAPVCRFSGYLPKDNRWSQYQSCLPGNVTSGVFPGIRTVFLLGVAFLPL